MATRSRMATYALGDAVVVAYEGQRCIGEVVGIGMVANTPVYDVSLEQVIVKALPECELQTAVADQAQSLIMGLLGGANVMLDSRGAYLRKKYVEFLTTFASRAHGEGHEEQGQATFGIGDDVCVSMGERQWALGRVQGSYRTQSGLRLDVEAAGELLHVEQEALCKLEGVDFGTKFSLGQRARMVAAGHELDPEFEGTICALAQGDSAWCYALMFDDGDIMEDLTEADLALA